MRIRVRRTIGNYLLYCQFGKIERVVGMKSLVKEMDGKLNDIHNPMFDFDSTNERIIKDFIEDMGIKDPVYCFSDKISHYRVVVMGNYFWGECLDLMIKAFPYGLDYDFFAWSVRRGYSTIRLYNKKDRDSYQLIILNPDEEKESEFNINGRLEDYQADSEGVKIDA